MRRMVFTTFRYTNQSAMVKAVQNIGYTHGSTNTASALRYMRQVMYRSYNGDRELKDNVAIILTDGNSNDKKRTIEEALRAKEDCHVIVISVGQWLDQFELNGKL